MKKLTTKAGKEELTSAWSACFPAMGHYRPLHLLKVAGPLAIGLYLEPTRDGGAYTPKAHLHSLAIEFPVVGMTPCVSGRFVTLREQSPDVVSVRATELGRVAPFLTTVDVRYPDIWKFYEAHISDGRFPVVTAYLPAYSAMIALATLAGRDQDAAGLVARLATAVDAIPESQRSLLDAWLAQSHTLLERSTLMEVVGRERKKHGCEKLPEVRLLDS